MRNLGFVAVALFAGFIIQILWWRMRRPRIIDVPVIFALVYAGLSWAGIRFGILDFGLADYVRLTSLYASFVVIYLIACAAIEVPSPTLSVIKYIAESGGNGCTEHELMQRLLSQDSLLARLQLAQAGGLVEIVNGRCMLTPKGLFLARVFKFGAEVFGLPKGA
jgi:hypothetical protein